jgi:hypothetical protein
MDGFQARARGQRQADLFPSSATTILHRRNEDLPVVRATERHRVVAHFATERTRLREAQVMGIRWPPTTEKTGLLDHVPDMIAVTNSTRFGEDKHTLVSLKRQFL